MVMLRLPYRGKEKVPHDSRRRRLGGWLHCGAAKTGGGVAELLR